MVSVIMPAHNSANTLGAALDSVLSQDYRNLEVLVVDDGSDDATAEVAASRRDQRLSLIRHSRQKGAAAARNTGMKKARGEFVAFLDSDDLWLPGKLGRQVAALQAAGGNTSACCTAFWLHHLASGRREVRRPRAEGGGLVSLLDGCFLSPGSTLLMDAACLPRLGPQDEDLPRFEDWDWLLAYCAAYSLVVLPEPLAVVNAKGWPRPETVRRSAEMLRERRSDLVRSLTGAAGMRRFQASLHMEVGIAWWRGGQPARALPWAARAGLRCPEQFWRRITRKLGRDRTPAREPRR